MKRTTGTEGSRRWDQLLEDSVTMDDMQAPPETSTIGGIRRTFSTRLKVLDSLNSLTLTLLLGLNFTLLGQTLVDLEQQLSAKTKDMSVLFISRGIGNFIGCMLAGPIYDRLNHASVLCVCTTALGVTQICIPLTRHISTTAVIFAAQGVVNGAINVGVTYQLVKQWGKNAGPFLHCIMMVYDVAGIIGPFVQGGFLNMSFVGEFNNQTGGRLNYSTEDTILCNISQVQNECALTTDISTSTDLLGLNLVIGGTMLAVALVGLGLAISFQTYKNIWIPGPLHIKESLENENMMKNSPLEDSKSREENCCLSRTTIVKVTLFASTLIITNSLEGIMVTLIVVYLVKGLHSPLQSALHVVAIKGIACCVSKLPMIFLSRFISGRDQAIIISILSTCGLLALTACVFWASGIIWVLCVVASVPLALLFSATMTWASQEVKVTGIVSSIFNLPHALGLVAGSALASFLFDNYGPRWFIYLMLIYMSIVDVLVIITLIFCHTCPKPMLTNQSLKDRENGEEVVS